ncbi:hypothetical protein ACVIGB_000775 [Bradyrhizobium sp. USDA 4341]
MSDHTIFVKIVGEPFRSRAAAFFVEFEAAVGAWSEFAKTVGATSLTDPLGCLGFDGKPPEGWTAKSRNGRSRPKRSSAYFAKFEALPKQPDSYAVFGDAVLYDLSYEGPHCSGSGAIGSCFWGPKIGRAGDVYVAVIPHAGRAAAEHLERHPDHRITNGAAGWILPEGLVEISEAEKDFIFAEYRLRLEREKVAA